MPASLALETHNSGIISPINLYTFLVRPLQLAAHSMASPRSPSRRENMSIWVGESGSERVVIDSLRGGEL